MTPKTLMRALLVALLLVALAPPMGTAQPSLAALLEDASGDLGMTAGGQPQPAPAGRFKATDLVALTGIEGRDEITLRVKVSAIESETTLPAIEGVRYQVYFTLAGTGYRASWRAEGGVSFNGFGDQELERYDAGQDDWDHAGDVTVTVDAAQATFSVVILRDDILDENGSPPMPGQQFVDFWATSRSLGYFGGGGGGNFFPDAEITDRMPDAGLGLVPLPINLGVVQSGDARLWSAVPVRSSNGEATTFVYEVEATNLGMDRARFRLGVNEVPDEWQVRLPVERIDIEGESTVTFPVLVTTPFAHVHGVFIEMLVEMTSDRDPSSVGRVKLGVRYTEIPQPAGHHDTLYFHFQKLDFFSQLEPVFGAFTEPYMNAAEEDPADSKLGATPSDSREGPGVAEQRYSWELWLSPGLDMGLDFDLARLGTFAATFDTGVPVLQARLDGYLAYLPGSGLEEPGFPGAPLQYRGDPITIGTLATTTPKDLPANTQGTAFETAFTPWPDSDYLAYEAGSALVLIVNVTGIQPTDAVPFILSTNLDEPRLAGGLMQLPLIEYHDPVEDVFASLPTVGFQVVGAQERFVNPGETAVFQAALENLGSQPQRFTLNITGYNAEWASLLQDAEIDIPAEGMRNVSLAVRVPVDTPDDEISDIILTAIDARHPEARALVRFVVTVDSDVDQPDDTQKAADLQAGKAKGIPAPSLPMLLLALAGLMACARRRRGSGLA